MANDLPGTLAAQVIGLLKGSYGYTTTYRCELCLVQ